MPGASRRPRLKPETMATLIQMARDIYPHDHLPDRFYAVAIKGYDEKAGKDPQTKATDREGRRRSRRACPRRARRAYADVGWEDERVALLRADRGRRHSSRPSAAGLSSASTTRRRSGRSSATRANPASKGGYIARGFDDIDVALSRSRPTIQILGGNPWQQNYDLNDD